jgi:DNA recombination protein RmuC
MIEILLAGIVGATLGFLIGFLMFRQGGTAIPEDKLRRDYVPRALFEQQEGQNDVLRADLHEKEQELRMVSSQLAATKQSLTHMDAQLLNQKQELQALQQQMQQQFELVANRLLEEKSQRFTQQNQQQMTDLLTPLRQKINEFQDGMQRQFLEDTRERVSLKKEIEQLRELNTQLSHDAHSLVSALKGDNKTQGDWGELQLERLLEHAGLQRDIHYRAQASFVNEAGQTQRPDFVIFIPNDKCIIVDSKVSLTAYEQYFSATDDGLKSKAMQQHVQSLRRHIQDLSGKNYPSLTQLHTPDYLLMFVPIEGALSVAMQHDQRLFADALERNIVLVSTATLMATLRTVSFIWTQEKQKQNVLEIAEQSGRLYDKLAAFVEDLRDMGQRLSQARDAYDDAMNKLSDSKRYGDTVLGRAERIRQLGAKTTKQLPKDMLGE